MQTINNVIMVNKTKLNDLIMEFGKSDQLNVAVKIIKEIFSVDKITATRYCQLICDGSFSFTHAIGYFKLILKSDGFYLFHRGEETRITDGSFRELPSRWNFMFDDEPEEAMKVIELLKSNSG